MNFQGAGLDLEGVLKPGPSQGPRFLGSDFSVLQRLGFRFQKVGVLQRLFVGCPAVSVAVSSGSHRSLIEWLAVA